MQNAYSISNQTEITSKRNTLVYARTFVKCILICVYSSKIWCAFQLQINPEEERKKRRGRGKRIEWAIVVSVQVLTRIQTSIWFARAECAQLKCISIESKIISQYFEWEMEWFEMCRFRRNGKQIVVREWCTNAYRMNWECNWLRTSIDWQCIELMCMDKKYSAVHRHVHRFS